MRNTWLENLARPNFQPSTWTRICSEHFEKDCFSDFTAKKMPNKHRFLKDEAIPTIFSVSVKPTKTKLTGRAKQTDTMSALNNDQDDHSYTVPNQQKLKRKVDQLTDQNQNLKKKLKISKQSKKHFRNKCATLKEVIKELKEKQIVSDSVEEILQQASTKASAQIYQRIVRKGSKKKLTRSQRIYSTEIKCFALTLQFYSSKAYTYVRKTFGNCLPHENVVRRWYSSVDAAPGFTRESFKTLEKKVEEEKRNNKEVTVTLVFD